MKNLPSLPLLLCLILLCTGCSPDCGAQSPPPAEAIRPAFALPVRSELSKTDALPSPTAQYTVEELLLYFSEIALDVENNHDPQSDSASRIRKWMAPIYCQVLGEPTEEDLLVINDFLFRLNQVNGIPEIALTDDAELANHTILFCTQAELLELCPNADHSTNGYVTIWWYNADLQVHKAEICIRSDIDQQVRSRVILHEIYQSLGMLQDTYRENSIVYLDTLTADGPNELDWLLLRLLYSESIRPGMNYGECETIIRELYSKNLPQ